jgi:putative PIN family toxin of toxin-antitoxin system
VRVLFDTNVLASAFTSSGLCHLAYERAVIRADLITTPRVLDELQRTLVKKMKIEAGLAAEIRAELELELEVVEPEALPQAICRDKDDDWVLAAALTGSAEIIVSGDKDLLTLKEFQGIKILTPRQFVELINAQK